MPRGDRDQTNRQVPTRVGAPSPQNCTARRDLRRNTVKHRMRDILDIIVAEGRLSMQESRMLTAIVGLVGVIVGALVSGVSEWLMASREERYGRIAAVRLTCSDLHKVVAVTAPVADSGYWGSEGEPLPTGGYALHSSTLARALPSESWKLLEGAMLGVGHLDLIRRGLLEDGRAATRDEMSHIVRIREHVELTLQDLDKEAWAIQRSAKGWGA